jgi:hypothetical protein
VPRDAEQPQGTASLAALATAVPLANADLRSTAGSLGALDTQSPAAQEMDPQSIGAAASYAASIDAGSRSAVGGWIADTYYSGGSTVSVTHSINLSHVSNPPPQAVYQSQRYGPNFTYVIPKLTPNAQYSVLLQFVESFWNASGRRTFNVTINGSRVLSALDIFVSAGGANIALARAFSARADEAGKITIQFAATKDNASIAGIAIMSGSSTPGPTPTPDPAPTPPPSSGDSLPWVYSQLWSSSSPFRMTVAQQKSRGATTVSHTYMNTLWSQHIAGNGVAEGVAVYPARSGDPLLTTVCTKYGTRCNATNVRIHLSSYAKAQQASDGHLTVVDPNAPAGPVEVDCWQAAISGSRLVCSWGGAFPLGGSGLATGGSEGIHGGMAVSSVILVGQEIANGHIDHALGLNTRCLNNPSLFPADQSVGTDTSCDNSRNPPHYGNLVHLLWSSSQIAHSAYSAPCKAVLTALATYGAYLDGTGNNGLQLSVQNELSYTAIASAKSQDPWPRIYSEIAAAGDGIYGQGNNWYSCMNRLQSSDFELLELKQP